ncbi:MAG: hypothetical protein H6665_00345 [Ardenticatenaceae bacterium]|nr:hypothetical protein [Ardenticatenaceae bacterium]MCB8989040.1 hypothetical protein [Ardenticatenaceae bacterium]
MAWGKLITKMEDEYTIDDHIVEGNAMVRILTAYTHKVIIIPINDVSRIEQGQPDGREWKLSNDGSKGISPF